MEVVFMDINNSNLSDWQGKEPDEESREKVSKSFADYLKKVIGKIPFIDDVVALFLLFKDTSYPLIKKGVCVFALLYFITPIDIIPDTIPVVGFLDDAGIIAAAIKLYADDIEPYKKKAKDWLRENGFRD
jgi:uncharacterized membrane protein YkvA (DUF1232 family)